MTISYEVAARIRERQSQYCQFVDTREGDGLRGVLSPELGTTFYAANGNVVFSYNQREAFLKAITPFLAGSASRHIVARNHPSDRHAQRRSQVSRLTGPIGTQPGKYTRDSQFAQSFGRGLAYMTELLCRICERIGSFLFFTVIILAVHSSTFSASIRPCHAQCGS